MKISTNEFNRIMDAVAFTIASVADAFSAEMTTEQLEDATRKIGVNYMEWADINDVEDEGDENDD